MENTQEYVMRIEELETKIMFQDDLIDKLNQSLVEQHQDIKRLTRIVERMANQLDDAREPDVIDQSMETPPPHY